MRHPVFIALLLSFAAAAAYGDQDSPIACAPSSACVESAAAAIARQAYEDAHSLAWRAVQTGPPNDPTLMFLLARTQSLVGRPQDAMVMLRRLVGMGFKAVEVETSDDFRRVRALADWPQLLDAINGVASPATVSTPMPARAPGPAPSPPPAAAPKAAPNTSASSPGTSAASDEGLRVPARMVAPLALAYDAVSRRFVLADDNSDTLKVLDELAGNLVDLVGHDWAKPYRPVAIAIDTTRGDLWVASVDDAAPGGPHSALHRLQLVSGRLLQTIPFPAASGPARAVDVAVGRDTVFVLDALGGRIFTLARGSKAIRAHMTVKGLSAAASVTLASETVLYAAHADGIVRVDLAARTAKPIATSAKARVEGAWQSIAWHNSSLFGIHKLPDGSQVAVRLALNRAGSTATARHVIGPAASRAIAMAGGVFYYLAAGEDDAGLRLRRSPAK